MSKQPEVKVPGEVSRDEKEGSAESGTVTLSNAQFASLMARIETLESRPQPARASQAYRLEKLPDESSIDLSTLKQPVLTKQGWIVPADFGAQPNAPK